MEDSEAKDEAPKGIGANRKLVEKKIQSGDVNKKFAAMGITNPTKRNLAVEAVSQIRHERKQKELEELTTIDELTGLENSRGFKQRLERLVAKSTRSGTPLWVIFMDLDDFKPFNTYYGQEGGDQALKLMRKLPSRSEEPLARLGGDEFVQALNGNIKNSYIKDVINRHRTDIKKLSREEFANKETLPTVDKKSAPKEVNLTFGAAELEPGETAEDLIKKADTAAKYAKTQGKDVGYIARKDPNGNYIFEEIPREEVKTAPQIP